MEMPTTSMPSYDACVEDVMTQAAARLPHLNGWIEAAIAEGRHEESRRLIDERTQWRRIVRSMYAADQCHKQTQAAVAAVEEIDPVVGAKLRQSFVENCARKDAKWRRFKEKRRCTKRAASPATKPEPIVITRLAARRRRRARRPVAARAPAGDGDGDGSGAPEHHLPEVRS